jgi:beta-xylosidase
MKRFNRPLIIMLVVFVANIALADNPLIVEQFSADPTARVFEGKIYVYPSHDMATSPGTWFRMEDYHVYSSANLMDWTDHGVILNQTEVPWLGGRYNNSMWAPDCVFKNGKYYFYFPASNRIGVAISDKPYGPFKAEAQPIPGAGGIDPGILIDDDGSAYMFWSGIQMVKLKDNMLEMDGQAQRVQNLPSDGGLIEGPFPFKRNGIYYITYPHSLRGGTERLEYSTASAPLGPYQWKGVIMDQSPSGCWTNHHSIVEYKGQWYLFYHDKDLSPNHDRNRSIKADYLYFNEDGTIQKVIPTNRGIGIADASREIQIDRYSDINANGTTVTFVDPNQKKLGWKTDLTAKGAWIRYNKVDFGKDTLKSVSVRALSKTGGVVEIRVDAKDGPVVAEVNIDKNDDWKLASAAVKTSPSGVHDLFATLKDAKDVEIDWVKFEK